ncbi:MAG: hypothetical protein AAGK00_16670 [Pseudomonadota bacterium]
MLRYLLPAILISGTAAAACPTVADLDTTGIWVRSSDGSITHYERTGPNLVSEMTMYDANEGHWLESHLGIYVVRDMSVVNAQRDPQSERITAFPIPVEKLPGAIPGEKWSGPLQITEGTEVTTEEFSIQYGPTQVYRIGDCEYDAIPADTVFMSDATTGGTGRLMYLTDLGIALFVASGEFGSFYSDFYTVTEISTEPLQ